ncbi:hypothetical protein BV25DRAFT_749307 [Artomyces pyxidatus]|uniref:Uncharacterized protein n=1 Tax=Artomyces pyxidatus TaxID=48021 RepID=A0ACB8T000_9AGAM|nr:hypothetical protein BV25DRAFT_749307 [Artomyces pyxidatus]
MTLTSVCTCFAKFCMCGETQQSSRDISATILITHPTRPRERCAVSSATSCLSRWADVPWRSDAEASDVRIWS